MCSCRRMFHRKAVCGAGRKIFVMLYGGKNSDSLSYLRYLIYMKRASSAANVKCESLPPTEQAAMFHIYRVYLNSMNGTHSWKVLWTQKIGGRDWKVPRWYQS